MRRALTFLVLLSAAACGDATSPFSHAVRQQILQPKQDIPYGSLLGATPPELVAQFDFEILYVDVPSRRQETVMRPFADNSNVMTWVGANKTSLYLQDDFIVIGSRGYGDDLAAALRPGWDELIRLSQSHQRYTSSYRHWGADEKLETMDFDCGAEIKGNLLIEACSNQEIHFENTYEVSATLDLIGATTQWISQSIGTIKMMRLN